MPTEHVQAQLSMLVEQLPLAHAQQFVELLQAWGVYAPPRQDPHDLTPKQLLTRMLNLSRKVDRKREQGRRLREELQSLVDRAEELHLAIDEVEAQIAETNADLHQAQEAYAISQEL